MGATAAEETTAEDKLSPPDPGWVVFFRGGGIPEIQSSSRRAITADPTWGQTLRLSLSLPTNETSARFSLAPPPPFPSIPS